jgi:uncharacterized protein (DUF362 family)
MARRSYRSLPSDAGVNRRCFLKSLGAATAAVTGGVVLGVPSDAEEPPKPPAPPQVETNLADFMKVPKGPHAIPGPFPGKVVRIANEKCLRNEKVDPLVVAEMVEAGICRLTGKRLRKSFDLLFSKTDIVGIKVNPVGAPLISTKPEVVEAVVSWLDRCGLPRKNIVIWDRFDDMLKEAGFTSQRFPGVQIEAIQTIAEDGKPWKNEKGEHVSAPNFDRAAYYYAKGILGRGVPGYESDDAYMNQHVFDGEYSYFGKLVTQKLTKIINLPVFKNTGNGISIATKNLGYGVTCNTGRLHQPLFFRVCTEVLAAPWVRDKLVLNIADGIRGQYDGGPMGNEQFQFPHHTLYFATDPFALDSVCHAEMVAKRKSMGVKVNESPRFTDYLRQAEGLGLGVADASRIEVVRA